VLGAVVGSPFFLVKTRMQAQTEYLPTSPFSALALRVLTPSATHSPNRSVAALAVGHQYKYKNSFQYVVLIACCGPVWSNVELIWAYTGRSRASCRQRGRVV
jgi:hypothetical protein